MAHSVKDEVLAQIDDGVVKMRPHWFFVLRGALLATGVVLLIFAILYLVSFIVFVLQLNGAWFAPAFGLRGLRAFVFALPWFIIVLGIIFLVLLEVLVERYAFAYRRPLLYSVLGLVLLVVVGGLMVSATSLHQGIFSAAERGHWPLADPLYRSFGGQWLDDVHRGVVQEQTSRGFQMETTDGEHVEVVITGETRLPMGSAINVGDNVVVLGQENNGVIQAYGLQRIGQFMPTAMHDSVHWNANGKPLFLRYIQAPTD